jgi:hypothetical protein
MAPSKSLALLALALALTACLSPALADGDNSTCVREVKPGHYSFDICNELVNSKHVKYGRDVVDVMCSEALGNDRRAPSATIAGYLHCVKIDSDFQYNILNAGESIRFSCTQDNKPFSDKICFTLSWKMKVVIAVVAIAVAIFAFCLISIAFQDCFKNRVHAAAPVVQSA